MNNKKLSLIVLFSGIILLLTAMFIIPVGGMSDNNPDKNANTFFFVSAELFTLIGLIGYVIIHIKQEQEKEKLQELKDECDLNSYESSLGEEQT